MQSCLGLYIENNLIKYAKVTKNNENVKVEAFGVKFYENLNSTIKQIVEETYSFKLPISINTSEEWHNNIEIFSLLSKQDIKNAIKTEFENICYVKEINNNLYNTRYIFTNSSSAEDKIRAIHISVPKIVLEQRKNQLSDYKINTITPISISISNLLKKEKKSTNLIINIEKNTTITKVTNGVPAGIDVINPGAQEILEKINQKENSYAKAYEICKNATIYTDTDKDLQYEENEYLEDIMPTLFKIVSHVRKMVDESLESIERVYITGTGALVNNIDIYFQDYLKNIPCEILKPSFINNSSKINIKDYIEVNSAIAIGLQGIEKNNNVNFKSESSANQVWETLNTNIGDVGNLEIIRKIGDFFGGFGKFARTIGVFAMTLALSTIVYLGGAILINNQLENKILETNNSINQTNERIAKIKEYNNKFNSQISTYEAMIKSIQDINNANSENKRYRNSIPNLLNYIMVVIPRGVQLTSITNQKDTHVVINVKSKSYQEIAYFKAILKTEEILKNLVSDTGVLKDGYLNVTIEGELP